jgi:hypothetical protein
MGASHGLGLGESGGRFRQGRRWFSLKKTKFVPIGKMKHIRPVSRALFLHLSRKGVCWTKNVSPGETFPKIGDESVSSGRTSSMNQQFFRQIAAERQRISPDKTA